MVKTQEAVSLLPSVTLSLNAGWLLLFSGKGGYQVIGLRCPSINNV